MLSYFWPKSAPEVAPRRLSVDAQYALARLVRRVRPTEVAIDRAVAEYLRGLLLRDLPQSWSLFGNDPLREDQTWLHPSEQLTEEAVRKIIFRGIPCRLAGDGEVSREDWSDLTGCRRILVVRAADIGLS
jgi:hypothetical protein